MRRSIGSMVLVLALGGVPFSAYGYNGKTHETLAREAILYMLRSSDPELRLVGAVLVGAGEGRLDLVSGITKWPISWEASDVDSYREVATKVLGKLPDVIGSFVGLDGPLIYALDLAGFSTSMGAFNHMLMYGMSFPDQHDNIPGQYLKADHDTATESLGRLLMTATSEDLWNKCKKMIDDFLKPSWALNILTMGLASAADVLIQNYLHGYCPGLKSTVKYSPALESEIYKVNSSTAAKDYFDNKWVREVIWHPVDNIAAAGFGLFQNGNLQATTKTLNS